MDVKTSIKNLLAHTKGICGTRKNRAMQLCETLALGDRRFLLLVRVEGQKFLVGAAGSSISLLAQIPSRQDPGRAFLPEDEDVLFGHKESTSWK